MAAQTERVMCEAVPAAAARWGRPDKGCASRALDSIEFAGDEHSLCGMHLVMWSDACERGKRLVVAEKWGWNA